MRVLGVSGSLRADSHNSRLLAAASRLLPADVEYVRFEGLKSLPPFDEDDERSPGPEVARWRAAIAESDGLLFATPEYNSSIPGQLKNAVDWASRPFDETVMRGKNAAVIGASSSMFGAVWAQAELRKVLGAAGARVVDRELPVSYAAEQFDAAGELLDADLQAALAEIV
ncbi:MAG TPA: NAD(P)H-dependent oxidoreductase, partial [Solirubrobacteraceae bacterium]|nr:NAD(P)H-dependent oxidoreductase [Solirubrobacteraceae bacterium]